MGGPPTKKIRLPTQYSEVTADQFGNTISTRNWTEQLPSENKSWFSSVPKPGDAFYYVPEALGASNGAGLSENAYKGMTNGELLFYGGLQALYRSGFGYGRGGGSIPPTNKPNGIKYFSGTSKAWSEGATPNSVYTYLSKDGKYAVSNYVYDPNGRVIYQVDFANHGIPSGHGHQMITPGNLGSGHQTHIPYTDVPSVYMPIPKGTHYSTPIGF